MRGGLAHKLSRFVALPALSAKRASVTSPTDMHMDYHACYNALRAFLQWASLLVTAKYTSSLQTGRGARSPQP